LAHLKKIIIHYLFKHKVLNILKFLLYEIRYEKYTHLRKYCPISTLTGYEYEYEKSSTFSIGYRNEDVHIPSYLRPHLNY